MSGTTGSVLRAVRQAMGLTQPQAAEQFKLSRNTGSTTSRTRSPGS
jgi:transcriptional regulator with XRE-family HTH domain